MTDDQIIHTEPQRLRREQQIIFVLFKPNIPPKPRGTTNHTNNTNEKTDLIFYVKKTFFNLFVIFVLFVVRKWVVGGMIKNFLFFVVFVVNIVLRGTLLG